jgi:hypothetical protein
VFKRAPALVVLAVPAALAGLPTPSHAVCGTKRYCTEMQTCAEAYHHFAVCGLARLDGDRDGVPCEAVCGTSIAQMRARIAAQPFAAPAEGEALPLAPGKGLGEAVIAPPSPFACGAKLTCREMTSCDEAMFHLQRCGLRRLDADGDGVPCEGLCR